MIEFIYGTAGSGKTTLVYERILADALMGEKVILLVPEQQVLSCERELARLHGTGVPMNVQVLSFGRLANTVFRSEGGLRYDYITRGQKAVLLWRAMLSVAPALKKYNNLTLKDRGFLTEAVSCIEEFQAYRITPALLEKATESLPAEQKEFKSKLADLSLIYASYTETLSRGYNDPSDDIEALIGILECSDFLNEYKVYLDSFNGYTAAELDLVRLIFDGAKQTTLTIGYDRTDGIAFASIAEADAALKKMAELCGKGVSDTLLTQTPRYKSHELKYLSRNIWDFSAPPYNGDCENIRLFNSHDIYTECEFIARDIHKRVREGGRYRDFAVIVRNLEAYDGVLDALFEKFGIPHFLSKRTDITLHPAVKCIISALSVGIGGWQTDDVLSYAKCGFSGITADECNILENYVSAWGITGKRWYDEYDWNMNPDGYTEELTEAGAKLLIEVNELRCRLRTPLIKLFSSFDKDTTVLRATEAVWELITEIALKEQLREEDGTVWNALLSALDGMVHCAAEVKVTPDVYRDLFLTLLCESDVGRIPAGNDQVTVGDASLLRLHEVEHVYIPGILEGEFPKSVGESAILSDAEKTALGSLGIKLSGGAQMKNSDELFYLWRAVSTPRSDLTLTYPLATLAGDGLTPSLGVKRVLSLFPDLKPINCDTADPHELIEEYESSFEYTSLFKGTEIGRALRDIYAADSSFAGRLSALDFSIQNIENSLSSHSISSVWKDDISLTQSRLDAFSNCAFSYYCKYPLALTEDKRPDFDTRNIGDFVHMLLERFMSKICEDGEMRTDITDGERDELIDSLIDEYIRSVFRERRAASPRLLTLISRLRRTAILLIDNIMDEFRNSDFRPAFFELEISESGENALDSYVIETPNGGTVRLYGKIDRVDTYKKGDDVYVRIVDYKTGNHDIKLSDIEKGKDLQMLLYLFAIWKTKDADFIRKIGAENGEIIPAGVEYYMAKNPGLNLYRAQGEEELRKALSARIARNGIALADEEVLTASDKSEDRRFTPKTLIALEEFGDILSKIEDTVCEISRQMRSGEAKAEWKGPEKEPCKYCSMQPVCRKQR